MCTQKFMSTFHTLNEDTKPSSATCQNAENHIVFSQLSEVLTSIGLVFIIRSVFMRHPVLYIFLCKNASGNTLT